jgi:hypothetical protein
MEAVHLLITEHPRQGFSLEQSFFSLAAALSGGGGGVTGGIFYYL